MNNIFVCVKKYPGMTIGKQYFILEMFWKNESNLGIKPPSTYFTLINDEGSSCYLPKSYFTTIEDFRNRLIDKITP